MNPRISVIIPVYNVEKYIEICVNSLLEQTFQDFEIILIDDGSTDKSGEICDSFSDERIRIFHQKNSGLSLSRNVGIDNAYGEYITYIDSDDIVDRNYLKILLSLVEEYKADISSCEFQFLKEGEKLSESNHSYETGAVSGMEGLKKMLQGEMHGTSACGLLLKKEIVEQFRFPVDKYHEDDLTTYKYFINSDTVAYTKQPMYGYCQHVGSIMHRPFSQIDIDELDAGDKIFSDCERYGEEYREAALAKKACNYFQILLKFDDLKDAQYEVYDRIMSFIIDNKKELIRNPYIRKKEKMKVLLRLLGLLSFARKIIGK